MSGHTPGPWRVDPNFFADVQTSDGRLEICTADAEELRMHSFRCPTISEAVANARLISAAPDLLEALEAALTVLPDSVGAFDWFAARAAIAKARGTDANS